MASVASQLIEDVTAHAQSDSLEDVREIWADGTYFPSNLRTSVTWLQLLVNRRLLAPPPPWLLKYDDLHPYHFAHLWHHSRFAIITCSWSWRGYLILIYTVIYKKSQLTLCRSNIRRAQQLVSLNLISYNVPVFIKFHYILIQFKYNYILVR